MTMLKGKIVGVYHDERGKFARFVPEDKNHEIDIPITGEQFDSIVLGKTIKIIVQIVI